MPSPTPNRRRQPPKPHGHHPNTRADPYFGYGYNPSWPSILSVAHDEADGGKLFVITDRPCTLSGITLPLAVAGKTIIGATTVLPIKFHLTMSGAIPRDAAWTWGTGPCQLVATVGGHAPNAGSGNCADIPGAYVPPPAANVVATSFGTVGTAGWVELSFDQPTIYNGGMPDGSITFMTGNVATSVTQVNLTTLRFELATAPSAGAAWNVNSQPGWIDMPVVFPQAGTL